MRRALPVLLLVFISACSKDKAPSSGQTASAPAANAGAAATAPATAATPGATAATPGTASKPGASDSPPAAAFTNPVPTQLPNVLARINGEVVNKAEFERAVSEIERQNGSPVPPTERDRIFRGPVSYTHLTLPTILRV